jgi:hypothetical protein
MIPLPVVLDLGLQTSCCFVAVVVVVVVVVVAAAAAIHPAEIRQRDHRQSTVAAVVDLSFRTFHFLPASELMRRRDLIPIVVVAGVVVLMNRIVRLMIAGAVCLNRTTLLSAEAVAAALKSQRGLQQVSVVIQRSLT